MKKKLLQRSCRNGFSLIEVVVALGISAILFSIIGLIFARMLGSYNFDREVLRATEEAQFAFSTIAKTVRVASIVSCVTAAGDVCADQGNLWGKRNSEVFGDPDPFSGGDINDVIAKTIRVYEFYRRACMAYTFDDNFDIGRGETEARITLRERIETAATDQQRRRDCRDAAVADFNASAGVSSLTTREMTGNFLINPMMRRITMVAKVRNRISGAETSIQASVALRDAYRDASF